MYVEIVKIHALDHFFIDDECCYKKTFEEDDFILLEDCEEDTKAHDCVNGCVYHKVGDTNPQDRWCFKKGGNVQPKCQEKEAPAPASHPCDRDCNATNFEPMTCIFTLVARDQFTDDPRRIADGRLRTVLTYNNQLPGPLLVVCEEDTVIVALENQIKDGPVTNADGSPNSTTLHFHGIREVGRTDQNQTILGPWSDGVPFVTQCPVGYEQCFNYIFKATTENFNAPPGSYWYHSHVGSQRTNGLQGGLVIKPREKYGEDVIDDPKNYTVALQEWYESPTKQAPISILVNGKGKVADHVFDSSDPVEVNKYLRGVGGTLKKIVNTFPVSSEANYEVFNLDQFGKKYRLRILGLIGQNFPIRVSIDGFSFTAISADSLDIRPVENVTYLWVSPGERFDILFDLPSSLTIKEAIKMRFIGYTNLFDPNSALCSIAWLKFPDSKVNQSYTVPSDCHDFPDHDKIFPTDSRVLNPPPKGQGPDPPQFFSQIDPYADIKTSGNIFPVNLMSNREEVVWIPADSRNNGEFIEFNPKTTFNGIRTDFPSIPYLLQDPQHIDSTKRCNVSNKNTFPAEQQIPNPEGPDYPASTLCAHVLQFPFATGSWPGIWQSNTATWKEIILINNGSGASHPIHQHGGWFWVVGEGQFQNFINADTIREMYHNGSLQQNIIDSKDMRIIWNYPDSTFWGGVRNNGMHPFVTNKFILPKDVIQVPNNGYVIIRTHLDNPGTWIFHCHIDFHLSIGMGLGILDLLMKIKVNNHILVQQIGDFENWNILNSNNPKISSFNLTCKEPPPSPRGGETGKNRK